MAFSTFSKEFTANMFTSVENQFITKYLPQADGDAVRVYLYGLYLCQCSDEFDADSCAKLLHLSKERLVEIFEFWEDCDLVHVYSRDPLFVQYLPVNSAIGKPKPIRAEKYTQFNKTLLKQLQSANKTFTPYAIQKIIEFLETYPMEQQAFLLVSEYCIKKHGSKITHTTILNKAKKLCSEHKYTFELVEAEVAGFNPIEKVAGNLVFEIGKRLNVWVENQSAFSEKYTQAWLEAGYSEASLLQLASFAMNLNYGFAELNTLINSLKKQNIVSNESVESYCNERNSQLNLLQEIQRHCGVIKKTQTVLDKIATWRNWQFSDEIILEAAKRSTHVSVPLSYMNRLLSEWNKDGIKTVEAIPAQTYAGSTKQPYKNEAAIAADERGEREHYYSVLRNKAQTRAEQAQRRAEEDEAYRNATAELKKGEIELAKAEVFAPDQVENIKKTLIRYQDLRKLALKNLGLTEADLLPVYHCKKCSDSGFLPNGKMCTCYPKQN